MRTRRLHPIATAAATLAAAALVGAGCGASDDAGSRGSARTTAQPQPATPTREPAAPGVQPAASEPPAEPPVAAAERAWLKKLERYHAKLVKERRESTVVTKSALNRSAVLYGTCETVLANAGDPGRFAPAAKKAERGCEKLAKAARAAAEARDAVDVGGAVVVGSPEEKIFDRAFGQALEASANGERNLAAAISEAKRIQREIERKQ